MNSKNQMTKKNLQYYYRKVEIKHAKDNRYCQVREHFHYAGEM